MRFGLNQKTASLFLTILVVTVFASTSLAQSRLSDVVMVLPFENTSNRPEYNWVGESFADSIADC